MSKPILFGPDGKRVPFGRFCLERSISFMMSTDIPASGIEAVADTTGTAVIPGQSSGDTDPNRLVMTTAASLNDTVRVMMPQFVTHRYAAVELEVQRIALGTTAAHARFGFTNGTTQTLGLFAYRNYSTSVGTRQPWYISERRTVGAGGPVNTETKAQTYSTARYTLNLVWFISEQWAYLMDGDAVFHSQAAPNPASGTVRPFVQVVAASGSAAVLSISKLTARYWTNR